MRNSAGESRGPKWSRRVEGWFFDSVPVHAMVLNRFILGGVLFLHAVSRLPEFDVLYGGESGAWSTAYREFVAGSVVGDRIGQVVGVVSALARLGSEPREIVLVTIYGVLLVASLAFALGLFTRTAGVIAVALHMLLVAVHPLANWDWSRMVVPFTAYVIFSQAGDHVSVDAWRRRRRAKGPSPSGMAPAWPMRLMQIHVAAMYFNSGFARIDDPMWLEGNALHVALGVTIYTRFNLDLILLGPALRLLSYATFVLEPASAILLWVPRVRTLFALTMISMHGMLEILTNVGWWNYLMIGGLLTFLPPPWIARLLPTARGDEIGQGDPGSRRTTAP